MGDKNYEITVELSDGSSKKLRFTAPQGNIGADGQRGTGVLKVTTAPASYTTTTGGKNPIKRMAISTIKTQAHVDEVLVGDQIAYSYYHYHVYYLDATYAYMDTYQSIRGASGADGKDAAVTSANIKSALGYTPADAAELDRVSQQIGSGLPAYYDSYLSDKIASVKALLEEAGADASTFIFFSDSHDVSTQHAPALAAKVAEGCNINHVFFLGDATKYSATDEADSKASVSRMAGYLKATPNIIVTRGNHDGAYGTYDENFMPKSKLYANYNIINSGKADDYGEENMYCYVDDKAERTRYIVLDTWDYPDISARPDDKFMGLRQTQYDWLIDALNVKDGWSIVVLTHIPPIPAYYNEDGALDPSKEPLKHLAFLLGAYDDKTTYTATTTGVQGSTATGGYTNLFDASGSGFTQESDKFYTNWLPYDPTANGGNGTIYHFKGLTVSTNPYKMRFASDAAGTENLTALSYCKNANKQPLKASDYDSSVYIVQHSASAYIHYAQFEIREALPANLIITADEQIIEASGEAGWDALDIDADFSTYKGDFVGLFSGHMHDDYHYTKSGGYGCDITSICADGRGLDSRSYNDATTYPDFGGRAEGTVYEQALDVVIINRKTKQVNTVRIGAGYDRNFGY